MTARWIRGGLLATAGLLAGCQTSARKPAYSDNPLLASRQPLIHSAAERERLASANGGAKGGLPPPVPLGPPSTQVVQAPTPTPPPPNWEVNAGPVASPAISVPPPPPMLAPLPARTLTETPQGPVIPELAPSMPVPASAIGLPSPSVPVSTSPRITNGKYGHSSDHTWLQGELDRHYRGYLDLRYRPASDEDTFGGKVRLEDDPRLGEFRAGDIIAVEGEIVRDGDAATSQYPRFRIRSVRLLERR